jgi:hypothetical protein
MQQSAVLGLFGHRHNEELQFNYQPGYSPRYLVIGASWLYFGTGLIMGKIGKN